MPWCLLANSASSPFPGLRWEGRALLIVCAAIFAVVVCRVGCHKVERVGWRLKTKFGPGQPQEAEFGSRLYSRIVRQVW